MAFPARRLCQPRRQQAASSRPGPEAPPSWVALAGGGGGIPTGLTPHAAWVIPVLKPLKLGGHLGAESWPVRKNLLLAPQQLDSRGLLPVRPGAPQELLGLLPEPRSAPGLVSSSLWPHVSLALPSCPL